MAKNSDPSDSAPINMADLTHGVSMSSTGEKDQALGSAKLWNLDRIDQRVLPLNNTYLYGSPTTKGTGQGAHIYVVDSGILPSHQEFMRSDGSGSRASYGERGLLFCSGLGFRARWAQQSAPSKECSPRLSSDGCSRVSTCRI